MADLHRNSRLVRWAYLWETNPWQSVSVCALFWRCVLFSPLKIALVLAVPVGVGFLLWVEVIPNWRIWVAVAAVVVALVLIVALVVLAVKRISRSERFSLLAEYLAAREARWCPEIRIVDGEADRA